MSTLLKTLQRYKELKHDDKKEYEVEKIIVK